MKNLYYKLMVSAIYTARNSYVYYDVWKLISSFYFAFATTMYMMFFYMLLSDYVIHNHLDLMNLKIINGKYNFIINMLLYFIIPIMSMNYFLIFKDKRYEELIIKYKKNYNKKLFGLYLLMSFFFVLVYIFSKVDYRF